MMKQLVDIKAGCLKRTLTLPFFLSKKEKLSSFSRGYGFKSG